MYIIFKKSNSILTDSFILYEMLAQALRLNLHVLVFQYLPGLSKDSMCQSLVFIDSIIIDIFSSMV